jgi:hypoxanthine phosphoribosyltransferase
MEQTIILNGKKFELYIPEQQLVGAIAEIAVKIEADMRGKNPLYVGVLNGAFMFTAELMSHLSPASELTFAAYSSYNGVKSDGIVRELLPIRSDVTNRPIVLLEDIIDTGLTMYYVKKRLIEEGVAEVRLATMLIKPKALKVDVKPDYVGLEVDNDYIVGFGLDYYGLGRNARNIYKLVSDKP